MASLIPGYEYDIFISYRQKDNKYDSWVTEFVQHLESELEATFKEEVTVYFDLNPHDGLLDTHDVDESLKEKLKCLIFIPIISRTYCDPRSFAWEHEFRAFVEMASGDRFGLKVKLPAGNVASRVLPVQIHELKPEDRSLVEETLGGFLRSIEFVYSEPGVNRPLTPGDSAETNMHRISYRNQINKVANSVDEVISGLVRAVAAQSDDHPAGSDSPSDIPAGDQVRTKLSGARKKWLAIASGSMIIILALISLYLFTGGTTLPFSKRDWVLITDFENHTGNPVFDKSLYTAFSISAGQSRYVNVFTRSRMIEVMSRMKIGDKTYIDENAGREIARREGISLLIVPGISKAGNQYAITAKIIETKTGNPLKSEILYAGTEEEILPVIDRLSQKIRKDLGESRYDISLQDKPLTRVTTSSLPALQQYSLGHECHLLSDFNRAREYYRNALMIDTGFVAAKASLGNILIQKFNDTSGRDLVRQAARDAGSLTDRERYSILAFYAENIERDYNRAIATMEILKKMYPDDPVVHNNLGWYYQQNGQYEMALPEYKQAVRLNPHLALTYSGILWIYGEFIGNADSVFVWAERMIKDIPDNPWGYFYMGSAWLFRDSIEKSILCFQKAMELSPDLMINSYRLAHTYMNAGNFGEAIKVLEKIPAINPREYSAYYNLGCCHEALGDHQAARTCFLKFREGAEEFWLKNYPDHYATYTTLASVAARLGEMDLSGQLLNKAVELDSTQYFAFAEVLCVQGNIHEALDYIELALDHGFRNLYALKANPDLSSLRFDVRLQNLLDKYFRQD
jgi:tetratricopeptide (TPR) repeat protein